jgi:hypothetical protein
MLLFALQMINKLRSFFFGLYVEVLNNIARNSSCELRILLFIILCGHIMFVKITRILLYFVKTDRLPIRINATQNDLNNNKRILLRNGLQYRYMLNFIIISSYILNLLFLESITRRWSIVIGCILYFVIDNYSVSLAQSYATLKKRRHTEPFLQRNRNPLKRFRSKHETIFKSTKPSLVR